MDYRLFAQRMFEKIVQEAPANHCSVLIHANGVLVDAGQQYPGGWMVTKMALEGLLGGRGQVGFAHQPASGIQWPALEVFFDDPLGMAAAFQPDAQGVFGVNAGPGYALGVYVGEEAPCQKAKGNLLAASPASLFSSIIETVSLAAQAVEALKAQGVQDIQWGWYSCPLAPFWNDVALRTQQRQELAATEASVNLWLRGEEHALRAAAATFTAAPLCLHELATACTYQNAQAEGQQG